MNSYTTIILTLPALIQAQTLADMNEMSSCDWFNMEWGVYLPEPGIPYEFEVDGVSQSITLAETVQYQHTDTTLMCNMVLSTDCTLDPEESYIEVLKTTDEDNCNDADGSCVYDIDDVLLVAGIMFGLLHYNCSSFPAVKIEDIVDSGEGTLLLYVSEASMFDYIYEMEVNITNGTMFDTGIDTGIATQIQKQSNQFGNSSDMFGDDIDWYNVTLSNIEYTCVSQEIDEPPTYSSPINGECDGVKIIDYFGQEYGVDTFIFGDTILISEDTEYGVPPYDVGNRRRRLGLFSDIGSGLSTVATYAYEKVEETVEQVIDVVELIYDLLRGEVNERIFDAGLSIDVSGSHNVEGVGGLDFSTGDKSSITVAGTFDLDYAIDFYTGVYIDLEASYKIFTTDPSFDYFKLVAGGETRLNASINLEWNGGITFGFTLKEIQKTKIFMLGPIPVVIKAYASANIGGSINVPFSMSGIIGYEPIFIEYGLEWKDGGWNTISDSNLEFKPFKNFAGEINNGSCLYAQIQPYFELEFGIELYGFIKPAVTPKISLLGNVEYPGSCDNNVDACDYSPTQVKFDLDLLFEVYIVFTVGIDKAGLVAFYYALQVFAIGPIDLYETCGNVPTAFDEIFGDYCGDDTTTAGPVTLDYIFCI